MDTNKLRYRVNDFFDIRMVLKKLGYGDVDFGDRIRCPNHDDRNPDAEVKNDREMVYCFVCREGWDQYELLTKFGNVAESKLDQKVPEVDGEIVRQDYNQTIELPDNQKFIDNGNVTKYLTKIFDELGINYIK